MNERNLLVGTDLVRRKQINTLRIFNENVIEVSRDVEYRVTFQTTSQVNLTMIVLLPPDFPSRSRPLIRIIPANGEKESGLNHPWLGNDNVVTGSPGLNSFGLHSDLGRVVQAIKREFERNPPTVMHNGSHVINNVNDTKTSVVIDPKSFGNTRRSIPEIENLTKEELENIQKDPLAFSVFCRKLIIPTISTMEEKSCKLKAEINETIETNAKLAKDLGQQKKLLDQKSAEFQETKMNAAQTARQLQESSTQLSKSVICDKLSTSSQRDESESEGLAEQFLSGDLPLDEFVSQYIKARTQHHSRKTKHEKLLRS